MEDQNKRKIVAKNRNQILESIVDFFIEEGRILTKREYAALGHSAPLHYRLIKRTFNSRDYHMVLKMCERDFRAKWNSIGKVVKEPVKEPVEKPVQEWEDELSPLERLRQRSDG